MQNLFPYPHKIQPKMADNVMYIIGCKLNFFIKTNNTINSIKAFILINCTVEKLNKEDVIIAIQA